MKPHDRLPFVDLLRALSSQAIVWHHLAFYGPVSDSARLAASSLIDGLAEHARLAVQVFFVVSGYLTAVGLTGREPRNFGDSWRLVAQRYRRVGLPYLGAMLIAICANELSRVWMDHPSISASPKPAQLLAHIFLVHDLVGYEPLSAGIWYLAIDLQLMVLVALSFWFSDRAAGARYGVRFGRAVLATLGVCSLFWFNRWPAFDRVAIYFMGAYGLGLVTAWVAAGSVPRSLFWLYSACVVLAMLLDFRSRLFVALCTALLLTLGQRFGWLERWPRSRLVAWAARISYSLFLIHFPVSLVTNALWSRYVPSTPWLSVLGMCIAYALSLAAAAAFHAAVELPLLRLGRPRVARVAAQG